MARKAKAHPDEPDHDLPDEPEAEMQTTTPDIDSHPCPVLAAYHYDPGDAEKAKAAAALIKRSGPLVIVEGIAPYTTHTLYQLRGGKLVGRDVTPEPETAGDEE